MFARSLTLVVLWTARRSTSAIPPCDDQVGTSADIAAVRAVGAFAGRPHGRTQKGALPRKMIFRGSPSCLLAVSFSSPAA